MSVVIQGMEMPKTCCQCDLKIYDPELRWDENGIEQIGAWICKRTREIIWNTQRGENCPLVTLPEGHGRLIDGDALQAKFDLMENALAEHGRPYSFAFKDGGEMCAEWWTVQDALAREPTIVPAEGGTDDG